MALAAVQGHTATTSAHESLLYSLISDDQLVQGPLDSAAYAQTDSTGTTTNRLAAVGGDSIDDITVGDPEVGFSHVLGGNVLVADQNPLNGELATTEEGQPVQPTKPAPSLYTVKAGDTVASIADQFNISQATLSSTNGLSNADTIRPGDVLTMLPVNGVLYKVKSGDTLSEIASKYDVNASDISSYNQLGADNKLALGAKLIIPGAQPPKVEIQPTRTLALSTHDDTTPADEPEPTPLPGSGVKMTWPTISKHLSQYFKWGHTGIDIDNRGAKVPIFAAADGVVEKAGWMGGYGNLTVLRHPDGKETYYGHQKKFYVEEGDHVTKGQVIGEMGSTGHSSGPHVHFEVRIGGKPVNPLAYL